MVVFSARRRLGTVAKPFRLPCGSMVWRRAQTDFELCEVEAGLRARLRRRESLQLAVAAKGCHL